MAAFDSIIDEILDKARKVKPPLASQVPKLVHAVIYDVGIAIYEKLFRRANASRKEEIVEAVRERVCSDLSSLGRCGDLERDECQVVFKPMHLKQSKLKVGLRTLFSTLKTELRQRRER
ncbi:hypothetical protein SPRG_02573 [Saprolegnia parasitica CBS 223.65]|uniref:Uncharacterized protein n=1 Tax=Saprolegnia parasitica (strain CBS 223.65) TaxID=695850 RepID=A0A067D2A3_SAPPC|nr:hypothetical protein SPRG_02573 [Saprolegnia parasitica CBS 223.65]KDO32881.1 hypothetical protein SPRG_02573 [Saprolegnia parasitica CBS 223.65]|eukprot:XP_012196532.1 hypothetical protein SPRG_02573 [Saprolegnia parasitica CBS 223.65]